MARIEGDVWRQGRDRANDPKRKLGPIDLNRYGVAMYGGIPTFMNFPVCLTQDDLRAGKVDVAVLGAPVDMSFGQRGTAFAPRALRTAERYIPGGYIAYSLLTHTHVMIKPFEILTCVDYGDAGVDPLDIVKSHEEIRLRVREIVETGAFPVVLGGDHSPMLPDAAALADVYGK